MHLISKSRINRSRSHVWPFIISPEYYQLWNTKIVSMDAKDRFVLNQQFTTRYKMSGKEMQCTTTITSIEYEYLLKLKHSDFTGNGINPEMIVYERITLKGSGERTVVVKDVIIEHARIPWLLIPLIWFVSNFGWRAKPDKLKIMCEAG